MKGRLKVYLGYAAGVGKTFRMLDEGQALREKGVDIVIGYFEPHARPDTIAKAQGFEVIPRRKIDYAGTQFEEMDTEAILRRRPAIVIVDEFAHTNIPGSERAKRWQDVEVLLESGIDVFTTMNVQHLESLNDQVWQATGVRVRETVPDWVVDEADEVVFTDLTPGALRNRLGRGAVYGPEKARRAMENFFTETNLTALREMALRYAAHEVEERMPATAPVAPAARRERILICLTGNPSSAALIRRGKRVADYIQADCLAIHVTDGALDDAVERHLSFARNLRIETHVVQSREVPRTIADFARSHEITQIFMGRSQPTRWRPWQEETVVQQVVRHASDRQITVVADRRR
jgi:two-component system sensor histidine kinase KdpD